MPFDYHRVNVFKRYSSTHNPLSSPPSANPSVIRHFRQLIVATVTTRSRRRVRYAADATARRGIAIIDTCAAAACSARTMASHPANQNRMLLTAKRRNVRRGILFATRSTWPREGRREPFRNWPGTAIRTTQKFTCTSVQQHSTPRFGCSTAVERIVATPLSNTWKRETLGI